MTALLKVEDIHTYIGQFHILQGVSLEVPEHGITVVLGRNGAGKSTTMRTIMGLTPARTGRVVLGGEDITRLPAYEVARRGIGFVPEDRQIFSQLTVEENLRIAVREKGAELKARQDLIFTLFPDLAKALGRKGGSLSGGQQQMLAIARALINDNRLLIVDEPSKGLAPIVVQHMMDVFQQLKGKTTILLVEQNFAMASGLGDYYYLIDAGVTVHNGPMASLVASDELKRAYLGIASKVAV